jgi:hypothetical protein
VNPLAPYYLQLKLVHLGACIVWAGSALGAFWIVLVATWQARRSPEDAELDRRLVWVRLQFSHAVVLEHVAFLVLVGSGLLLQRALSLDWMIPWFAAKCIIVFGVFVPLEAFDVWLSHWRVPHAVGRAGQDPDDLRRVMRWHDVFLWGGGAVVMVLIPFVVWLIVVKPA